MEGEGHGGAWKVAYADFVTAMMAFFLLMWLLNATTEEQRKGLADYFSPNSVLSHNSSGTGQPFGGRTAFSDGAMLSDLGSPEVTVGKQPVVDQPEDDGSDVVIQPRPHRDDMESKAPDLGGRPPPRPPPQQVRNAAAAGPVPVAAATAGRGDVQRKPSEAELRAELEKREKQSFDQAAQQIRDVVSSDPQLQELARQLVIDTTPDGLRIQIRDADREPMFAFGSAEPNDKARLLLQKMAPVLAQNDAGHLDRRPHRRSAIRRFRPHQLGTFRRPCQYHATTADRIRSAGNAHPQRDRQCRARPGAAKRPTGRGQSPHRHRGAAFGAATIGSPLSPCNADDRRLRPAARLRVRQLRRLRRQLRRADRGAAIRNVDDRRCWNRRVHHGKQHARPEALTRRLQENIRRRRFQEERLYRSPQPAVFSRSARHHQGQHGTRATYREARGKPCIPKIPQGYRQPLRLLDDLRLHADGWDERRRSQPDRGRDGARAEEDAERGAARRACLADDGRWPACARASSRPCSV